MRQKKKPPVPFKLSQNSQMRSRIRVFNVIYIGVYRKTLKTLSAMFKFDAFSKTRASYAERYFRPRCISYSIMRHCDLIHKLAFYGEILQFHLINTHNFKTPVLWTVRFHVDFSAALTLDYICVTDNIVKHPVESQESIHIFMCEQPGHWTACAAAPNEQTFKFSQNKSSTLTDCLCEYGRLWWNCMDAQAYLSLRFTLMP